MRLLYPITPELVTLACGTLQELEHALKSECSLSILQYRMLSYLRQHDGANATDLSLALQVGASQLSQNFAKLKDRKCVSWEFFADSTKGWSLSAQGDRLLDDADATLIETYNRLFSGLDSELHENVRTGLKLTSQSMGTIRVKDGRLFDELAYFESVLPAERIVTKTAREFGLGPAEFRILYELLIKGPTSKANLARSLMLARSTITWACGSLSERNLMAAVNASPRGQSGPMFLTEDGRRIAEKTAEEIDHCWSKLRVWAPEERQLNQQVAEHFAQVRL